MKFIKEKWESDNEINIPKIYAYIDKIQEEEKLFKIASSAPLWEVRDYAAFKITDKNKLFSLALNFSSQTALEKIKDDNLLKEIAVKSNEIFIKKSAVKKINDKEFIINFTENETNPEIIIILLSLLSEKDKEKIKDKKRIDNILLLNIKEKVKESRLYFNPKIHNEYFNCLLNNFLLEESLNNAKEIIDELNL